IALPMPCNSSLPLDSNFQLSTAGISIYPNPASGRFIISSEEGYIQHFDLELYNLQAKKLENPQMEYLSDKKGRIQLKLPAGLYFLKVNSPTHSKVIKIQQLQAY